MGKEMGPSAPQPNASSLFKEGVSRRHKDGSFNEQSINTEVLAARFGLRTQDVTGEITYGAHTGTMVEMLDDTKCPLGGKIEKAFQTDKEDGLKASYEGLNMLGFDVKLSEETIKLNREGTLMDAVKKDAEQGQKKN